ncbi:MAG: hypothetical protein L6Q54_03030 [Leptospiraceae bacterium]|nr:hypothetical protein [Leptospiraceae bacterium]MCK6380210.1 hypothetical protein [Leptospiraceae bacterium]NUM41320.1 hypothetical protein [Leptospiraceae bacterium]
MKNLFKSFTLLLFILISLIFSGCQNSNENYKNQADTNALAGILGVIAEKSKLLELNGKWQANTGSGTSTASLTTISAVKGSTGAWIDDSSSFGGYNMCVIIVDFDNTTKTMITQNPEKQGNCPNGFSDSNKGKFNKIVWTTGSNPNQFYFCSVTYGQATRALAEAVTDNSVKTNPSVTGCCSGQTCATATNSWSKLDRVAP